MFQGQHLRRGNRLVDFDIRLGEATCVPVSLTDDQVDCRPPTKRSNDMLCQHDTLIYVRISVIYTTINFTKYSVTEVAAWAWSAPHCAWSTHATAGSGRGWLGVVVAWQADLSGRLGTTGRCTWTAGRSGL